MSIRLSQIVYSDDEHGYLPEGDGTPVSPVDVLSLVRHILRDRSDCDQIPVVNQVTAISSPNEYGDNLFIDVTYSSRGYRATYGARLEGRVVSVQCYMD